MESGGSGPSGVGASELSDPPGFACARGIRASWPDAVGWAERCVSKASLPARDFLKGSIAYVNLSPQMKSSRPELWWCPNLNHKLKVRLLFVGLFWYELVWMPQDTFERSALEEDTGNVSVVALAEKGRNPSIAKLFRPHVAEPVVVTEFTTKRYRFSALPPLLDDFFHWSRYTKVKSVAVVPRLDRWRQAHLQRNWLANGFIFRDQPFICLKSDTDRSSNLMPFITYNEEMGNLFGVIFNHRMENCSQSPDQLLSHERGLDFGLFCKHMRVLAPLSDLNQLPDREYGVDSRRDGEDACEYECKFVQRVGGTPTTTKGLFMVVIGYLIAVMGTVLCLVSICFDGCRKRLLIGFGMVGLGFLFFHIGFNWLIL